MQTGDYTRETWLTRTEHGWAEPRPPACACGSERFLVGFTHCLCGAGPLTGGHRTWSCRECERSTDVGCTGHVALPGYGC